jgi:hypothetical protein
MLAGLRVLPALFVLRRKGRLDVGGAVVGPDAILEASR